MKRVIVYVMLCCLLFSCSLQDEDATNFEVSTFPVKSFELPDSFELGSTYDIKISYEFPNRCYSFYDFYNPNNGNTIEVAINALVSRSTECADAIVTEEKMFRIKVINSEDYIFKFWKTIDNEGKIIYEIVTVPVIDPT